MRGGWRWFWRLIGLLALGLSIASCFFLYGLWKASALVPVAKDAPIHSLDVISLQIDILSITLASAGIALAVVGLFGYQTIKDQAVERAVKLSLEASHRDLKAWLDNNAAGEISRMIAAASPAEQDGGDNPLPPLTQQEQEEALRDETAA